MSQLDQHRPLSEFDHFFQEGLFDVFKKKEKPPVAQPQTLRDIADVFKAKGFPTDGIEQLAAAYEDPEFVKGAEKTGHHVFQYEPWNKYLEENYKDVPDAIDDLRSLYVFPEKSIVSFINEELSIRDIDKSTFDPSNHNEYDEQARVVCLAAATEQSDDTGIGYSLATGKIYHAYCWSDEDSAFLAEFSDFVEAVKAFAKSDAVNDQSNESYKEHHVNTIENTTDQIYTESRKGFSRAALSTRRAINRQFYRPLYMILLSEEDIIAKMIRKSTKSDWSHCALSLDVGMNHIYSFNIAHSKNSAYKIKTLGGFSRESLFDPGCAGLRTRIYAVYVPESAFLRVQSQIGKWCEDPKDTKYDYVAILKRIFVDDIKRSKSNDKKVCSSFVNDIMALAGRSVSKKVLPSPQDMDDMAKVTPSECYMVYDGAVRDYEPEKILKKLESFTDSEISKPWVDRAETESAKVKKPKFSRFVQEEDQLSDEITVGDLSLDDLNDEDDSETDMSDETSIEDSEDGDNSGSPDDVPGYLKGRLSDDDLKAIESAETEDMDPNSVELGSFGSDNSPEQNEYDPKDVDTLMKLMASEADAMAEYLDAAKETNTDVLRRLYADIGNEERFHMEQLLYAKCQLAGEKYEPKDPEVKSEYEELLAMGMDEETAMQTAVDRLHIRGSIETDVQDAAEIAGNISDDIATLEQAFAFFNAELARMESADSPEEANKAYATFVECCYVNEAVHLKNSDDRGINITRNPVRLLLDALAFIMKQLIKLVRKIKEFVSMVRNRKNDVRDFIKRYGWERIFDAGIKLYFDPTTNNGTIQVPQVLYQWAALAIETIELAAKNVGLANAVPPAYHEFCAKYRAASLSPSGDLSRAIGILNQVHLTPTKVLIPREKDEQEMFVSYLLGYQDMKAPNGQSRNIINEYQNAVETWEKINKIAENVLNFMYEHENDANFTKFKNPTAYNKSVEAFQTIGKTFSSFSTAITADINTIIKLNKTVYDEMKRMDDEYIQKNKQNNPGT